MSPRRWLCPIGCGPKTTRRLPGGTQHSSPRKKVANPRPVKAMGLATGGEYRKGAQGEPFRIRGLLVPAPAERDLVEVFHGADDHFERLCGNVRAGRVLLVGLALDLSRIFSPCSLGMLLMSSRSAKSYCLFRPWARWRGRGRVGQALALSLTRIEPVSVILA